MIANNKRSAMLKCVADGGTLREASEMASVSSERARQLLVRLCRELGLPFSVDEVRADPKKYLTRLEEFKKKPQFELRKALVHGLLPKLKLKTETDLTPKYVSNLTASQLLNSGVTLVAVTEIQEWLSTHGLSLTRRPPETDQEIMEIKRAIAILDVFHFNTAILKEQLQHFEGDDE